MKPVSRTSTLAVVLSAGMLVSCQESTVNLFALPESLNGTSQATVATGSRPDFDRVRHLSFSGFFAEAVWNTTAGVALVFVTTGSLVVSQTKIDFDENGNPTGGTDLWAAAENGFSFDVQQPLLGATVKGSLPGLRCRLDANLDPVSCVGVTVGVDVTWMGEGDIDRQTLTVADKSFEPPAGTMVAGAQQSVTRAATITDDGVPVSDLWFARFGSARGGVASICIGGGIIGCER